MAKSIGEGDICTLSDGTEFCVEEVMYKKNSVLFPYWYYGYERYGGKPRVIVLNELNEGINIKVTKIVRFGAVLNTSQFICIDEESFGSF